MPSTFKTSNSDWLNWTVAANATTDGIVDSTANPTTAFTIASISVFLSSLRVESSFNTTTNTLTVTGGTGYAAALSSYNTPSGYTLYLAPSKTVGFNYIGFSDTYTTEHVVYVDSGARLNSNAARINTTANVTKSGPGTWRISSSENSNLNVTTNLSNIRVTEGTLLTESGANNPFGNTATLTLNGGTLQVGVTRSFANPISVLAGNGTITANTGVTATFTSATSGAGTLTIARSGSGNVTWNSNLACSLNVTGLLTMGATYDITGATLSGVGGTIAMQSDYGNTISADAPTFTGTVTGLFEFNRSGTQTFGGVIGSGAACNVVPGTVCTFTGASLGRINAINATTAKVTGSIAGSGTTVLINSAPRLELYGPSPVGGTIPAGLTVTSSGSTDALVGLYTAAVVASTINEANTSSAVVLGGEDTSSCTYSGTLTAQATAPAALKIRTKGNLTLSGSVTGGGAGRTISLNSDTGYSGTIKVTGTGFTATSPVALSKGALHLNRDGTINMTGGLTVSNLATVACSSTGAYAAQLAGALTLNAGAIMQFGAP